MLAVARQASIKKNSLAGIRARYVQPYEDHSIGGGVRILDASIDSVERAEDGLRVDVRRTDTRRG